MRKLILVTAIVLLSTSAHAGPSRGLVLASTATAPAATPATPAAQAAPAAPAGNQTQAPAKPDKGQVIFEQLVKHGLIKLPNQTAPAAPSGPAAVAPVTAPVAVPAAAAPATPVTAAPAVAAPVQVTQPQTVQSAPAPQPASTPVAAAPAAAAPLTTAAAPVVTVPKVKSENPKTMSHTETRIRAELRRHGIR
jgi:hypothetical protein